MKRILFFVLLVLGMKTTFSQSAKAAYFELGGPGLASFNYDTRFSKKEDGIGGRIGFGGFSIGGAGAVFIPIGLNYLIGKDGRNYFEVGGGVTPVFAFDNYDNGDAFSTTFGHLNFGYRLQPKTGGFFFRAAINPVFGKDFFFPYYGGVAFGYKF
ncbi:MAG TPA: hypothetical protein VNT20_22905 [Flavisolibacter sp.]|jgi:hypothetical protein|nr:hypothetical protein [Flavisolibacter sp.]